MGLILDVLLTSNLTLRQQGWRQIGGDGEREVEGESEASAPRFLCSEDGEVYSLRWIRSGERVHDLMALTNRQGERRLAERQMARQRESANEKRRAAWRE